MIDLTTPIAEDQIRQLKVGDVVSLNGVVVTARDAAHKYMVENWIESEPSGEDAALRESLILPWGSISRHFTITSSPSRSTSVTLFTRLWVSSEI